MLAESRQKRSRRERKKSIAVTAILLSAITASKPFQRGYPSNEKKKIPYLGAKGGKCYSGNLTSMRMTFSTEIGGPVFHIPRAISLTLPP